MIDWIVSQTWSNGKVGTWGPSALGVIQYQTAKEKHPNHICAVPQVASPQQSYDGYFYGGVLEKSYLQQLDAWAMDFRPQCLETLIIAILGHLLKIIVGTRKISLFLHYK